MSKILAIVAAVGTVFTLLFFTTCTRIVSGEAGFQYNVTSGKEVNEKNSPALAPGFNVAFGVNERFFVIDTTTHDYHFTGGNGGSSSYNESLDWNSSEGIDMSTEFSVYGRVSNIWEFYLHYGHPEHDYQSGKLDVHIYEALRQAGKIADVRINEIAATMLAEDIRLHPDKMRAEVLAYVQEYMRRFGFEVTDLQFSTNFEYPHGDTIQDIRQQMTQIESSIRQAELDLQNTETQNGINLAEAQQQGKTLIEEASRRAAEMDAQTKALSLAMKASVEQVGVEGAVSLKSAELFAELVKAGKVGQLILTEKSVFGEPFYPVASPEPAKP